MKNVKEFETKCKANRAPKKCSFFIIFSVKGGGGELRIKVFPFSLLLSL